MLKDNLINNVSNQTINIKEINAQIVNDDVNINFANLVAVISIKRSYAKTIQNA